MPEQLPGHEPVSTRKGYEDGNALFWRYRRVEGLFGRDDLAPRVEFTVCNDAGGYAQLVKRLRGLHIAAIGVEASGGYERGVVRALLAAGLPVRQINPFKLRTPRR
jgi:transposase